MSYQITKRSVDVALSLAGLVAVGWLVAIAVLIARIDTGASGVYRQQRIGRRGHLFWIYKIRTMKPCASEGSTITTEDDPRVTRIGRFWRRWKIDELPQLVNVLKGEMSLVGPRPEVPAYLKVIQRDAPLILHVRPGITGPASVKYRYEERLLANQDDPIAFNDDVIFPDKLRINTNYVLHPRIASDLKILYETLVPSRGHYRVEATASPSDGSSPLRAA